MSMNDDESAAWTCAGRERNISTPENAPRRRHDSPIALALRQRGMNPPHVTRSVEPGKPPWWEKPNPTSFLTHFKIASSRERHQRCRGRARPSLRGPTTNQPLLCSFSGNTTRPQSGREPCQAAQSISCVCAKTIWAVKDYRGTCATQWDRICTLVT
jgi:hypothetical protein